MFDSKFHGHQSMKLQLSYEIMFGYVQKLQIAHLIPLKIINIVNYNKLPSHSWAGLGQFLGLTRCVDRRKEILSNEHA